MANDGLHGRHAPCRLGAQFIAACSFSLCSALHDARQSSLELAALLLHIKGQLGAPRLQLGDLRLQGLRAGAGHMHLLAQRKLGLLSAPELLDGHQALRHQRPTRRHALLGQLLALGRQLCAVLR